MLDKIHLYTVQYTTVQCTVYIIQCTFGDILETSYYMHTVVYLWLYKPMLIHSHNSVLVCACMCIHIMQDKYTFVQTFDYTNAGWNACLYKPGYNIVYIIAWMLTHTWARTYTWARTHTHERSHIKSHTYMRDHSHMHAHIHAWTHSHTPINMMCTNTYAQTETSTNARAYEYATYT